MINSALFARIAKKKNPKIFATSTKNIKKVMKLKQ